MRRWVYAHREVMGEPREIERLVVERSGDLLALALAAPDEDTAVDGSFLATVPTVVGGMALAKRVRVCTGVAFRSGERVLVPLAWHAEPARHAFPVLEGHLEVQPLDRATVQLTLSGSYRAPFGPVGVAFDAMAFRAVARRTAQLLVATLASELSRALGSDRLPVHPRGPRGAGPLLVRDVMTSDPLVIDADLPVRTAALLLFYGEISGAPVVHENGALLGVLSERDLLAKEACLPQRLQRGARAEERRRTARTAGEACSRPARVTVPSAPLTEAAREMLDHDVSRLVVIDDGHIDGIVSRHDVLAALVRSDADILAAVEGALAEAGVSWIAASAQWGVVSLSGTIATRTAALRAVSAVFAVDGVIDVDDLGLQWEVDDVVPAMLPMA